MTWPNQINFIFIVLIFILKFKYRLISKLKNEYLVEVWQLMWVRIRQRFIFAFLRIRRKFLTLHNRC